MLRCKQLTEILIMCNNCLNSGFHQEGPSDETKAITTNSNKGEEEKLDPSSLAASAWSSWIPEQITDGVVDVYMDKTLQGLARKHAIDIIEDIDAIIGTPVRFVDQLDTDTDIRIGVRDDFEGITDPKAAGVAHIDANLVANAYIRNDYLLETDKQISFARAKRRGRRLAKGRKVRPLRQVLQSASKMILTHEILHTFGLSHPDNDGLNPAWDTNDSVMSYNLVGDWKHGVNSDVSALDTAALLSIWSNS